MVAPKAGETESCSTEWRPLPYDAPSVADDTSGLPVLWPEKKKRMGVREAKRRGLLPMIACDYSSMTNGHKTVIQYFVYSIQICGWVQDRNRLVEIVVTLPSWLTGTDNVVKNKTKQNKILRCRGLNVFIYLFVKSLINNGYYIIK